MAANIYITESRILAQKPAYESAKPVISRFCRLG